MAADAAAAAAVTASADWSRRLLQANGTEDTKTAKDYGSAGMAIGILIALFGLACVYGVTKHFYYKHEKRMQRNNKNTQVDDKRTAESLGSTHDSDMKQQRLPVWTPTMTPQWVIGTMSVSGLLLFVWGVIMVVVSNGVTEIRVRYDNIPACQAALASGNGTCSVNLRATDDLAPPLYLYYELSNFYQNHRTYVKSRDEKQLRMDYDDRDLPDCSPLEKYGDSFNGPLIGTEGDKYMYPCGLIAATQFRDVFDNPCVYPRGGTSSLCTPLGGANFQKEGIAWSTDLDKKFKARPLVPTKETNFSPRGFQMPPVDDEDLIVWMRVAASSTFTKLYRKISNYGLNKGDTLTIRVTPSFDVSAFDGEKALVLSNMSWLGGRNNAAGYAGVFTGILALLGAVFVWAQTRSDSYQPLRKLL